MFSMLEWAIACNSNPEIRANRNRITLYVTGAAARRLVIGVDEAGIPVIGIPFSDRTYWAKTEWSSVVFVRNGQLPDDINGIPNHSASGPIDRLGLVGRDGKTNFCIWMPTNPKIFDAIITTSQRFGGISDTKTAQARMVSYYAGPGKPEWLRDEDIGIFPLVMEENVQIDHDLIWKEKTAKSTSGSKTSGFNRKKGGRKTTP